MKDSPISKSKNNSRLNSPDYSLQATERLNTERLKLSDLKFETFNISYESKTPQNIVKEN